MNYDTPAVFYPSWFKALQLLPEDFQFKALTAILDYAFRGVKPEDPFVRAFTSVMCDAIDRDRDKLEEKRRRRVEAGRRGGKATQNKLRSPDDAGAIPSSADTDGAAPDPAKAIPSSAKADGAVPDPAKANQAINSNSTINSDSNSTINSNSDSKHIKDELVSDETKLYGGRVDSEIKDFNLFSEEDSVLNAAAENAASSKASPQQKVTCQEGPAGAKKPSAAGYDALFEEFRKLYPGHKNAHKVEFANFKKVCRKEWQQVLPRLKPALWREIEFRRNAELSGMFVPQWPFLSRWLKEARWEQEFPDMENDIRYKNQSIIDNNQVNYGRNYRTSAEQDAARRREEVEKLVIQELNRSEDDEPDISGNY